VKTVWIYINTGTLPGDVDHLQVFATGEARLTDGSRSTIRKALPSNTLGDDFRDVRETLVKPDKRQLADMRRSGAIEGDAGGGSETDQSNKMANSIATNKRLRKTYNPVNVASVRRFDEARMAGAAKLKEHKPDKSVRTPALLTLSRRPQNRASDICLRLFAYLARETGLEPATSGVTGQRVKSANQSVFRLVWPLRSLPRPGWLERLTSTSATTASSRSASTMTGLARSNRGSSPRQS
jgi:hypothetical protein